MPILIALRRGPYANLFSQDSSIDSVTDALLANFASEQLDG